MVVDGLDFQTSFSHDQSTYRPIYQRTTKERSANYRWDCDALASSNKGVGKGTTSLQCQTPSAHAW